ncbi:MAG: aminopeptidase P family protein [candidate division Zixibacteria bacterium]|nr:aminopeptidase P family protein [candidate division Zixibacteria bacterium]
MSRERIKKFQAWIKKENLDGFIVRRHESMRYLCGFSGGSPSEPDGVLIVKQKSADFITDFRYYEQARKELKGAKLIKGERDAIGSLKTETKFLGKNLKYGFEPEYMSVSEKNRFQESLGDSILIPFKDAVEMLSIIKEKSEVEMIQKACDISDAAFQRILGYVKPGLKESEVCAELEYQMMMLGSDKAAFETILASGFRSALPHGSASKKKIAKGDFVTFDFGATFGGYVSDMTRTIVMGKATARQKKVYNTVKRAQLAGLRKVKSGVLGKAVDLAARKVIDKAGYKKYFRHGTGHGIGMYVHMKPSAGPLSTDILKRGMVLTVEPGIYFPGWGGVRIEDDVLVTNTGCRVLNSSPKKLLEI